MNRLEELEKKYQFELVIKVAQYLYYVECKPLVNDYEYDKFCHDHDAFGGGGSDCATHYSKEVKQIARELGQ